VELDLDRLLKSALRLRVVSGESDLDHSPKNDRRHLAELAGLDLGRLPKSAHHHRAESVELDLGRLQKTLMPKDWNLRTSRHSQLRCSEAPLLRSGRATPMQPL